MTNYWCPKCGKEEGLGDRKVRKCEKCLKNERQKD